MSISTTACCIISFEVVLAINKYRSFHLQLMRLDSFKIKEVVWFLCLQRFDENLLLNVIYNNYMTLRYTDKYRVFLLLNYAKVQQKISP